MAEKPTRKTGKPQPTPPEAPAQKGKGAKRNVIFLTLDGPTEDAVQRFVNAQRVKPDRAAVGLTALLDFLEREGFAPVYPPKQG